MGITCSPGGYEEAVRLAWTRIFLAELGVSELRARRTDTGVLAFEIPGADAKTDALAGSLRRKLTSLKNVSRPSVEVSRPVKTTELWVRDFDESVTTVEIALAVATEGECRQGDVRVRPPSRSARGLYQCWLRCPTTAAKRSVGSDTSK